MGKYAIARSMFKDSLLLESDQATADEIRGMVTATYYGEGLHQEGLEYICEQYKFKTANSHAFLFGVHAHLRAISVSSGSAKAETIAAEMRTKCQRPDFSEFWAHIPFGMMENLRIGNSRTSHGWTLTKEAKAKLSFLLDLKRRKAMKRRVPFADFALYFLDRFDEILSDYPDSSIREITLFDAASFSKDSEAKINYLKRFINEYPNSENFNSAIESLVNTLEANGERRKALVYASKIHDRLTADSIIDDRITQPSLSTISSFIRKGDLRAALKLTGEACNDFKIKLKCPNQFGEMKKKINLAISYTKLNFNSLACSRTHIKIRNLAETGEPYKDNDWRYAARSYLVNCIENIQNDPEDYARSLYLIASISRKINDYKTSLEYLLRFKREIHDHDLLDDVICEIGYHQMFIEENWTKAKLSFSEVISKYPKRNAYDNALWWYAIGSKDNGDFAQAISAFAKIASLEAQSRFGRLGYIEHTNLIHLTSLDEFSGISLRPSNLDSSGLIITAIDPKSPFAKTLSRGDRLIEVCSEQVDNVDSLLKIVDAKTQLTYCNIDYLRGNTLFHFSKKQNGKWLSDKTELPRINGDGAQLKSGAD
jgi:tetratricopeptide (TPR) repeat protein